MTTEDIRWKQRFNNFIRAYRGLDDAVQLHHARGLSKLEQQGLIQGFEFTHELAWNVLKDYLQEQGVTGLMGSKDSSRAAFKLGLIEDGETWMEMIKSRNLSLQSYDEQVTEDILTAIIQQFLPSFNQFQQKFSLLMDESRKPTEQD